MRYYIPPSEKVPARCGKRHRCNHPAYDECTVFIQDGKGIAVIQQRYDPYTKHTWWGPIDDWLSDAISNESGFLYFLAKNAKESDSLDIYPTFTVRQIMRRLGMPPLKKEPWETRF